MSYRAKAFPYPVLAPFNDDFTDGSRLRLDIDVKFEEDGQTLRIEYKIEQTSDWLDEIVLDGKARVAIDVECSSTLFRSYIPVTAFKDTVVFGVGELYGTVTFTPVIVALESIDDYRPDGINAEFGTEAYSVTPGDLLAIGEGHSIDVEYARSLKSDLVTIRYTDDLQNHATYDFDFTGSQILILAGADLREPIEYMRARPNLKPFLYMSIYKDLIAAGLNFLAELDESEREERPWARSLLRALEESNCVLDASDPRQQEISAQVLVSSAGVRKVVSSNE